MKKERKAQHIRLDEYESTIGVVNPDHMGDPWRVFSHDHGTWRYPGIFCPVYTYDPSTPPAIYHVTCVRVLDGGSGSRIPSGKNHQSQSR